MKRKFIVYANGNIYTVNKLQPKAEAVVVEKNTIVFVGSFYDAKKFTKNEFELFDLQGAAMLPGFIDSHLHLLLGARNLANIDLSGARDKNSFQKILLEFHKKNKRIWRLGGNWNEENFIEKKLPDKKWIDEVIPDVPAFLMRSDLHMGLANDAALKVANITAETKNPPGGIIERDSKNGEPTGILKDNAMKLVLDLIPDESSEEKKDNVVNGIKRLNSFGITSVHDFAMEDYFSVYENLLYDNKLSIRVNYVPLIDAVEDFSKFKIDGKESDNFLKRIAVKSFADGSLGSSTAWFFDGYEDEPENKGLASGILNDKELKKLVFVADNNNIQLIIHAIGDRAVHEVINLFEETDKINGKKKRRNRIEHCQHIAEKDFNRFTENGIIASMQPYHLAFDGRWCEKKIGVERAKNSFPVNSLAKRNVKLIFGSDWPVVEPSPLKGIAAAVTRRLNDSNLTCAENEKISVMNAVEAYTINAAYAEFEEMNKGSIENGKLADFVILERDIFNIPHNEIGAVRVKNTVVNGKSIFSSDL